MNIGTREDLSVLRFRKGGSVSYFTSGILGVAATEVALSANELRATPFFVAKTERFDRIAVNVTSTPGPNYYARLGIYADNGQTAPGRLILDAGQIDVGSTGVKEITISQELLGGQLYWLAIVDNAATYFRAVAVGTFYTGFLGISSGLGTAWYTYPWKSFTYAALPDPFGAPTAWSTGVTPAIFLRKV